ncbi:GDSL esterase/lipase EXL6-like isoform X2 [Raphanus sativus]|uniref:GDSL esterase/lipase EXL6-like isoform X2 n=1 Tax=Raphanus sativus TaxID=3726 RepID=A0A6J0M9B2_RAPSA|nr:GDSL esterase/lipase EXL6-like isoform X2 [Raphanus sativus]
MFRENILVLTLFSIYWLSSAAGQNKSFSAVFAFGDSILDTGNNNRLLTVFKGNYWPYGWNYDFKIPTGRFGNGRVFTDMVAQGLGLKRVVPAYRRMRRIKRNDLKTGVCFASESLIDRGPRNNDIAYFVTPARLRLQSKDTYTSNMVFWTKTFLQDLYDLGARKFAVMGAIPVGCLPFHRFIFGGVFAWCNFMMNKISEDFNTKLRKALIGYEVEECFKGAKFVYVDMYGSIMNLINHPKVFGFTEAKRSCCCMVTSIIPCRNPDEYVFYDFAHPTMKAYEVISKPLIYQMRKGLA